MIAFRTLGYVRPVALLSALVWIAAGTTYVQAEGKGKLAESGTITVTVQPLGSNGSGQEGVGFGVALTTVQDDLYILLTSPSGTTIQPTPTVQSAGDAIWQQPLSPPWLFHTFGMSPGADHSVDIVGSLANTATASAGTAAVQSFNTAAADIQMDVFGGSWGRAARGKPALPE